MTERISRRAFVGRAAVALAAHNFALRPVWALTEPSSLAEPSSPLVKRVVRSPENTYYTYPHSNGFLPNGACVLASPTSGPENPGLDYLSFDFNNGNSWLIAHVRDPRMYYAIGRNGMMAVPRRNGMYLIDTTRKNDRPRSLFETRTGRCMRTAIFRPMAARFWLPSPGRMRRIATAPVSLMWRAEISKR